MAEKDCVSRTRIYPSPNADRTGEHTDGTLEGSQPLYLIHSVGTRNKPLRQDATATRHRGPSLYYPLLSLRS